MTHQYKGNLNLISNLNKHVDWLRKMIWNINSFYIASVGALIFYIDLINDYSIIVRIVFSFDWIKYLSINRSDA